jgi:hypothetical protein
MGSRRRNRRAKSVDFVAKWTDFRSKSDDFEAKSPDFDLAPAVGKLD